MGQIGAMHMTIQTPSTRKERADATREAILREADEASLFITCGAAVCCENIQLIVETENRKGRKKFKLGLWRA